MEQSDQTICIIGSGATGINAIKVCREEGFNVVCYEQSNFLGGLWKYREDDVDGLASVMRSTIINSSKEMSAYSDFPPPKEFANYMHNTAMYQYFEMYAERFGVREFIQFETKVIKVEPADDYDDTGRWRVVTQSLKTKEITSRVFDGVMVCTGHHVKPLVPTFKGQEKFKGRIIHTHSYKKPNPFENETVVVVGIGNSGGDAAVELSMFSKKVYLSTRRGAWILWRVGPGGQPFDSEFITRFCFTLFNYSPYRIKCSFVEHYLNNRFDHKLYRVEPDHRVFGQHPMVNDTLPNRILSGTVVLKNDIQEFTEDGIIFEGESTVTKCDSVILATGYEVSFPFLDPSIVWTKDNHVELYKYMFPPKLKHPHTLGLIGLIQAVGPAIPVSEQQSRWYVQLMKGTCRLPSVPEMMKDIEAKHREIESRYFKGPRHTMQIDWVNYMDEIAEQYGAKPNLLKYFFTDPKFWYKLYFGPCLPYQYRLQGPHAWDGARNAIMTVDERIDAAFATRSLKLSKKSKVQSTGPMYALLASFGSVLFVFRAYLRKYLQQDHWRYLAGASAILFMLLTILNYTL
ncbi:dimethylaniline monooxygenase [N-oxide-forming] 5 [Tetranychus urticae]|nr:dimethylaniline monooxygenase [N-oxide-forming] 5 [Tetranychus urticae]